MVLVEVARAVREMGGRAYLVGGWVRDGLLGVVPRDLDVEVHGLADADFEALLGRFGRVRGFGRAHRVLQVQGVEAEFSSVPDECSFREAARRRDLTINSMGWDPLERVLHDPCGGRRDLRDRVLRASDAERFGEDPLRALRVAHLAARLEMRPDDELVLLCRAQSLTDVPGERVFGELRGLLAETRTPSVGLELIRRTGQLLPELKALVDVPQDDQWHPEGDVWIHTLMVVDEAAQLKIGNAAEDELLMLGALCHDLGKPSTTRHERGRVRSPGHDVVGAEITEGLLESLRVSGNVIRAVVGLVRHHLAPSLFVAQKAKGRGYRRLARQLDRCGVDVGLLVRLARADHWGRTTEDARLRRFDAGDRFLAEYRALDAEGTGPFDVVKGRHVLERGIGAGPEVGRILALCRRVQDDTGWSDPERILDRALSQGDGSGE